jgi:hypothetical protein
MGSMRARVAAFTTRIGSPLWARILLLFWNAAWALVGVYSTLRSELPSRYMTNMPSLSELLPRLSQVFSWQTWLIGLLLILLAVYVEDDYRRTLPAKLIDVVLQVFNAQSNLYHYVLQITNNGERRKFNAQVELLDGSERDVIVTHQTFALGWASSTEGHRTLGTGEKGAVLVATAAINDARANPELCMWDGEEFVSLETMVKHARDGFVIPLQVRILTDPDLPNGPILRRYSLGHHGLTEVT